MPVRLDWEIDDLETPLADVKPATRRLPHGCRRRLRLFALLALAIAIGLGLLALQVRHRRREAESVLRAIVELELNALIQGDRDLFLDLQDPNDWRWMRAQVAVFDQYRRPTASVSGSGAQPAPEFTADVPVVSIKGDEGWAFVQITHAERAWRELWFYRWTQAAGWRHTRLNPDWLGDERERATPHLRFTYSARDEAIVAALAAEMEAWYSALASLLGVSPDDTPLLTVEFTYRNPGLSVELSIAWDRERLRTLLAPSPHQSRLSPDGRLSPELRQEMAGYLAEALIALQTDLPPHATLPLEVSALRRELRDWVVARSFAASNPGDWDLPPTPFMDALVRRDGVHVLPPLVASLPGSTTLDQALAAAGVDPPDPTMRFALLLAADNQALYRLDDVSYQALTDPWADEDWLRQRADQLRWRRVRADRGYPEPPPPAVRVRSVVFNADIAWVEAETGAGDSTQRQVYFFRRAGEPGPPGAAGWLLTSPDPAYFGARRTTQTQNLVIHYFARDAAWYENIVPEALQTVFEGAATDLGIPTDRLLVTIEFIMDGYEGWQIGQGPELQLTSPTVTDWSLRSPDAEVLRVATPLVQALIELKAGDPYTRRSPYPNYLFQGQVALWELRRLFPARAGLENTPPVDAGRVAALALADVWSEPTSELDQDDRDGILAAHRTLVEYLAQTYGPDVIPALLDGLSHAEDIGEWLYQATGHNLQEIEPAWHTWLLATYGE